MKINLRQINDILRGTAAIFIAVFIVLSVNIAIDNKPYDPIAVGFMSAKATAFILFTFAFFGWLFGVGSK